MAIIAAAARLCSPRKTRPSLGSKIFFSTCACYCQGGRPSKYLDERSPTQTKVPSWSLIMKTLQNRAQTSQSSNMQSSKAPVTPPTVMTTAEEAAPLAAPRFANGSAYDPFVPLLLPPRQISVEPSLAVSVFVTLPMWLMNCGRVFQYLWNPKCDCE